MNKFDGMLDRLIITKSGKENKNINLEKKKEMVKNFSYSSYWGTWNRTLVSPTIHPSLFSRYHFIEVNLTPINRAHPGANWEEVRHIIFRTHGTPREKRDKEVSSVPKYVREDMVKHLGEELTERLISEDWLGKIDLEKLRNAHAGGGLPFEEIKMFR
jgi:hypothetical protein